MTLVIALIMLPKLKLIEIAQGLQGIRIEDLLALAYVALIFMCDGMKLELRYSIITKVNAYLILVSIISTILYGVQIEWIFVLRLVEYQVIAWAIYSARDNLKIVALTLKFYIAISFVLAIFQVLGLVGAFSSIEILRPGHPWLDRAYGLGGGPWDLAVTIGISLLCLQKLESTKKLIVIYQILTISCLLLSGVRAAIVGYLFSQFWFYKEKLNVSMLLKFIWIPVAIIGLSLLNFEVIIQSNRLYTLYQIVQAVAHADGEVIANLMSADASINFRFLAWFEVYQIWSENIFNIIFGLGFSQSYLDGFYARLLFSFGIVGSGYLIYKAKKIDAPVLIFLGFNALTLDIFVSQKIFAFIAIYLILFNGKQSLGES